MPFAAGYTTCDVTTGSSHDVLGEPIYGISGKLSCSHSIVDSAGNVYYTGLEPIPVGSTGDSLNFTVLHTNQANLFDFNTGGAITGFYYTLEVRVRLADGYKTFDILFAPVVGQSSLNIGLLPKGDSPDTIIGAGAGGVAVYHHTQSSAASVWTVHHNQNRITEPVVLLSSLPTVPVWPDLEYPDANTVIATFPSPVTGSLYY